MEWQHPEWLYLILPLGAAWLGLALYSRRRRHRAAAAFVAQAMWSRILPIDSPARFWMKTFLRDVALVCGLLALAGPRFGTQFEEVIPHGSDLYVLIDVSRSMLADDVPPSRLGRAKSDVAALVNRLQGERVGLIAFAGQAVVKCPLTVDYDSFRRALDELDPGSAPRGGTAIGDAIRKALEVFHSKAERDQAILLITDGDDQQSYPLEAATVAAERHVTIFAVGLGDADHGARIPQGNAARSYVEYEGQQVWSKLDGTLLKEIALKTSGVYVPVGTRAYDLGELYVDYLQNRRGAAGDSQKRIRRSEQFQIFLALALFALLADLCIRRHRPTGQTAAPGVKSRAHSALPIASCVALVAFLAGTSRADEPEEAVRDGMRLYAKENFDEAREKFAAAREAFDHENAERAAIAAFDEACASHRKGDIEHAREWYLKAGLSHDRLLAAKAHFNLGTLVAEEARRLAGEHPEDVPVEKREAIVNPLKGAVASLRHSLELQPDNARARRDIELIRMWIKYYTDKWREHDRQQRRDESNLLAFLEFLIEAQRALRESVKALPSTASADTFAELKRVQDELYDEIMPLKQKIKADLQPQQSGAPAAPGSARDVDEGIALLQGWAEAAGQKMKSAAGHLASRRGVSAVADEQSATKELEKIWEAIIPFPPLLARDLADETQIAGALEPAAEQADAESPDAAPGQAEDDEKESKAASPARAPSAGAGHPALDSDDEELIRLTEKQEQTLRRTQLLKLKAEAELERLEKAPVPEAEPTRDESESEPENQQAPEDHKAKARPVDPEQIKEGYRKAIELAPEAVTQMEKAVRSLKQKERKAAYPPAEEARKILEEIQKAQPRSDPPPEQDKKEQEKKDQDKKDQDQKDQDKKDQNKKDENKKDDEQQDQDKKDEEKKKQDQQDKAKREQERQDQQKQNEKKPDQQKQPQVSRDRIEEALRRVRERQQVKRERDRKQKAGLMGRAPVEKDW